VAKRPSQGRRGSHDISDLTCFRLGVDPAALSEVYENREIFQDLGLLHPRSLTRNKQEKTDNRHVALTRIFVDYTFLQICGFWVLFAETFRSFFAETVW